MPDEKLEFSAQDLGRLAYHYGTIGPLLAWLHQHSIHPGDLNEKIRQVQQGWYLAMSEEAG